MTKGQDLLVDKLIDGIITRQEFINKFEFVVENNIKSFLLEGLKGEYLQKNPEGLSTIVYIISKCNLVSIEYVDILCDLIISDWHYEHENIAMIFKELKEPKTIEYLYKTVLTKFDYLDYDDSYALAVKCIWALGEINTIESKKVLEKLKESDNDVIKKEAVNQLNMRSFKN